MRCVMAVVAMLAFAAPAGATTAAVEDGTLLVVGTPGRNAIVVGSGSPGFVYVGDTTLTPGGGGSSSLQFGAGCSASAGGAVCGGVTTVSVQLRGGSDSFTGKGLAVDATVDGGSGNDVLRGGAGDQLLRGGSGRDRLVGGIGRDVIAAGSGRDRIDVRDGAKDSVDCGPGRDRVERDRDLDTLSRC